MMLDAIRKRKENFFYSLLILMTAAVMLFFGVGGPDGGGGDTKGPVAWVNGEMISGQDYQQAVQNMYFQYASMLGNQYDEKLLRAFNIEGRALDELIREKLISQEAKRLGISVSDKELGDYIRTLPNFQTKDGKFDVEGYKKMRDVGKMEREIRDSMLRRKLQTFVLDRVKLTPDEVRREFWLRNTKVDIEFAKLDFNNLAPAKNFSDSEINKFLQDSGKEVKDSYDAHQGDYTEKASVKLKQIRIGVPFQASEAQKIESRKKIDAIKNEVTPQNFDSVAKAKSDDEFAKKGGEVGWTARGTLEKPLEEALDKLGVGQVSPVVEAPFGYYLLLVSEKKDAVTKPYDEVKKLVAAKILREKSKKTWAEEKQRKIEGLLAEGKSIDGELKTLKVTPKKTGAFSLGQGFIPQIGQSDSMVDAVFELNKQNPVAKKLFFHQDAYYTLKLASLEVPKEEEFAKEKEGVERNVATTLQNEVFRQWLEGLEKGASIKKELALGQPKGMPGAETEQN